MRPRPDKLLFSVTLASIAGVVILATSLLWYLWRASVTAEEQLVGGLAATLGQRTEELIVDTRNLLLQFDRIPSSRCSTDHLRDLERVSVSRPHIRGIGFWRAAERQCGVGFLQSQPLRPPHADSIYASGMIAWWPSIHTEAGGVQLFLMRFGDHDVAIDPRALLDVGPLQHRQAGLWVESRLLAAHPPGATLPLPHTVPIGLTLDRERGVAISRYSRPGELPVEIVALEALDTFWQRYRRTLATGTGVGLILLGGFAYGVVRYTRHRLSMGTLMREAIANGRLAAQYQPVVELITRRIVGAEALARWTLDSGESVPPDVFIPLAESEGMIADVTRSMLSAPLRELRELLLASPNLSININVSAEDLSSDGFVRELEAALLTSGLPTKAIKLEITERALANTDVARALIRRLRDLGHEVAVDDFGTGYSSLSYLSGFELDWLKIDKSFVDAIGTDSATSHVIVHVIEMARSLGLRMVAEGVETEAQVKWLIAHGVELGQGYYFSAPLSAAAFSALCARGTT